MTLIDQHIHPITDLMHIHGDTVNREASEDRGGGRIRKVEHLKPSVATQMKNHIRFLL
jgi:hypothetical protein